MHALLYDRGPDCPTGASVLFSAQTTASTCPISLNISWLNHRACMLAVYASSPPLPTDTQDSLPVGGQPCPDGY
jgi:hypothetical protein